MNPSLFAQALAVARKDVREGWRDGRLRLAIAALALVSLAAAGTGYAHTAAALAQHREAEAAERAASLDRGEMNPHAAAHYGAFVFKPIEPLAALDPGVDPFVGVSVFLEAHQQNAARHQPVGDATAARRLGELSVALVLQLFVPLLLVVFAAPAIAGERDRGTLAQLVASGVGMPALVLGKLLGCAAPLAAALLPLAGASLVGLALLPDADADAAARLALMAAAYLVYFAGWLGVGLAVSARAHSSASALGVLLAVWFAAAFVAPRVAIAWAGAVEPTATAASFDLAVQAARDRLPSWPARVEDVEDRFLEGTLPLDSDMPSNPEVIALVDAERDESALYDRLYADQFAGFDRQADAFGRLGWLLPTVAVQGLSMALAGTDYAQHRAFLEAARTYREQFLGLMNGELVAYREANTFDYTRGRELWERLPPFAFTPPSALAVFRARWTMAAGLGVWLSLGLAGVLWTFRRLRVR